MKKRLSVVTALIGLLCLLAATFSACGGNVKNLTIEKGNLPQTTFVQGNDPDFSKGTLTADGKSVPLTADGVEISGYDKDKLGAQELTVSYKGQSVTFTVNVVPRFQTAESYVYFVGEPVTAANIRLKVTRDDGTSFTVSETDESLTLTGFDSSVENANLTLSAAVADGGTAYTGTFAVSVVTPQVSFKKPRKLSYGSHDTEIDLSGASLTMKSADGKTVRNPALTELTVSGFDPSAVSEEHETETQVITVSYSGVPRERFEITLKYSDVTRVQKLAKDLETVDWSKYEYPDPDMYYPETATPELKEKAVRALELFNGMTSANQKLVTDNEIAAIGRLAIIYGYNESQKAINSAFDGVFRVSAGAVSYLADTKQKAADGAAKLREGTEENLKTALHYGDLLTDERFLARTKDIVIYDGATKDGQSVDLDIGSMSSVIFTRSAFNKIGSVLDKAVSAAEALETLPANWSSDDLWAHRTDIDSAEETLVEMSGNTYGDSSIFSRLEDWRKDRDFFEILYRYYYDVSQSGSDQASLASQKIDTLTGIRLPDKLETMGEDFVYANVALQNLQAALTQLENDQAPLLTESTLFLYFYLRCDDATTRLQAENDAMYLNLYGRVYDSIMVSLQTSSLGYFNLTQDSAFNDAYLSVWKQYLVLWEKYNNETDFNSTPAFSEGVKAMFEDFTALHPNQQMNFIHALNFLYEYGVPGLALYPDENGLHSTFATFVYTYYCAELGLEPETASDAASYDIFTDLMIAMESCANGDYAMMYDYASQAKSKYEALAADSADKAAFDSCLKFLYDRYQNYAAMFHTETGDDGKETVVFNKIDLGDQADNFKALYDSIANLELATVYIETLKDLTGQSVPIYLSYLASYENMLKSRDAILASEDENILKAYYYQPYGETAAAGSASPLFNGAYKATATYQRYLYLLGIDQSVYESATALRSFIGKYETYFWTMTSMMYNSIPNMGEEFNFTQETVTTLMSDFRALSTDEQYVLVMLDALSLYYGGLTAYFEATFEGSETLISLSSYTLSLEMYYILYSQYPEGSYTQKDGTVVTVKELILSTLDSLNKGVAALEGEEKTAYDAYFAEMYEYYKKACENIKFHP